MINLKYFENLLFYSLHLSLPVFFQVQFFFSCPTQKGNTQADSADAVTPLPRPIRACLALRIGWATTGPTIPCWPKPGGPACWGTRNWPIACYEISQTFVPTKIIDWWPSGKAAWRKWTPVLPEDTVWEKQRASASRADVLLLPSNRR